MKDRINSEIITALKNNQVPWQKPWVGWGDNLGFPRNIGSRLKYFGINFVLLQMAAKRHGFKSKWWGTAHDFKAFGYKIAERPPHVEVGCWGTVIVSYKIKELKVEAIPEIVYNADQLSVPFDACVAKAKLKVDYEFGDKVLSKVPVEVKLNEEGKALYYYPPQDYITMPSKIDFEMGINGLPAYYECLAHELMHYTETRLNFKTEYEAIRELRAEIGAAMLMQELRLPHSITLSNFRKWSEIWVNFMTNTPNLIFRLTASASRAVDYILSFSDLDEERFNEVSENVA